MLYTLQGVLNQAKISRVKEVMKLGQYQAGSTNLNAYVKTIKHNEELTVEDAQKRVLNDIVLGSLYQHAEFVSMAYPGTITQPIYAHYTKGMAFGAHVDAAIMGVHPNKFRSDISCTIFLNDTSDYDGGELIIETGYGPQKVKLPAGDAVLYPTNSLHRVAEVTSGERIVAVSWICSMVPDAEKRALLYQLEQSVNALNRKHPGEKESLDLNNILTNLQRRWCIG
jgi:PKHD-type hydroxylase